MKTMFFYRFTSLVLLFCLGSLLAFAQDEPISGKVYLKSKGGDSILKGVIVSVNGSAPAVSNSEGAFDCFLAKGSRPKAVKASLDGHSMKNWKYDAGSKTITVFMIEGAEKAPPKKVTYRKMQGKVMDYKNFPLKYVSVKLPSSKKIKGVFTNAQGAFSIQVPSTEKISKDTDFTVNGKKVMSADIKIQGSSYIFLKIDGVESGTPESVKEDTDPPVSDTDNTSEETAKVEADPIEETEDNSTEEVEETDSVSASVKQNFDNVLSAVDRGKEALEEQNEVLKRELDGIHEILESNGQNMTEAQRKVMQEQFSRLESVLQENEEAFREAQKNNKEVVRRISSQLWAKDSLYLEQKETIEELKEDKEKSRTRNYILGGIIIGLLIIAFISFRVISRIRKQKYEIQAQAKSLQSANKEILSQKDLIEKKNKKITSSINYASRIQNAFLPAVGLIKLRDSFIFFRPRDIVSGDFYWFSERDGKKVIIVADCTGHGVPGAFMTIMANSMLNTIVNEHRVTQPDQILYELDKYVLEATQKKSDDGKKTDTKNQIQDGMDLSVLVIDENNKKIFCGGAKNPIYRVRDGKIETFKGSKFPIGSSQFKKKKVFETTELDYRVDDVFYLSTDGFQDQFGGGNNSKYMVKHFRAFLEKVSNQGMEMQYNNLHKEYETWKGDYTQTDDVLVIGLKV